MNQIFYKCIYNSRVNSLLRSINKLFAFVIPRIKIPPSGKITVRLKNKKQIQLYTNQTSHVSQVVFWKGLYAYKYIAIFEDVIQHCTGFMDIGANTGIYSLIAASTNKNIQVIAFDPTDAAQYYLSKNIAENAFTDRIFNYPFAVSNEETQLQFYKVRNPKYTYLKHNLGGASSLIHKPENFETVNVQCIIADDFMEKHHPALQIDFIKIDAEGAEPEIIQGLKRIIEKYTPIVVYEVRFNEVTKPLTDFFSERNYAFYLFAKNQLTPINNFTNANAENTDCFFVPQDKMHWIDKFIS